MDGKKNKALPISEVLKSVFSQLETEKSFSEETIAEYWKNAAGDGASTHSKPKELKKNVLKVSVDSSVWMQELTLRKRRILKALQRTLGKDRISEIHFKIGEF